MITKQGDALLRTGFKVIKTQISVPAIGRRRIAIVSSPLMTTKDLASGTCMVSNNDSALPVVITDTQGTFLSSRVDAGHTLERTASDEKVTYTMQSVISEDRLTVPTPVNTTEFPLDTQNHTYRVYKSPAPYA